MWVQWWSKPAAWRNYTRTMFVDITDRILIEQEQARLRLKTPTCGKKSAADTTSVTSLAKVPVCVKSCSKFSSSLQQMPRYCYRRKRHR